MCARSSSSRRCPRRRSSSSSPRAAAATAFPLRSASKVWPSLVRAHPSLGSLAMASWTCLRPSVSPARSTTATWCSKARCSCASPRRARCLQATRPGPGTGVCLSGAVCTSTRPPSSVCTRECSPSRPSRSSGCRHSAMGRLPACPRFISSASRAWSAKCTSSRCCCAPSRTRRPRSGLPASHDSKRSPSPRRLRGWCDRLP